MHIIDYPHWVNGGNQLYTGFSICTLIKIKNTFIITERSKCNKSKLKDIGHHNDSNSEARETFLCSMVMLCLS